MPAFASSRKKRKITASASASAGAGARLTQTELDAIAAPANESDGTNKYNLKYEPDDPSLTEEQRAQWRKEQRKARNRASAAASRHKTKARIDELEGEVGELKRMYAAAVARIAELEGAGSSNISSRHSNISASAVGFPTDFAAGVDRVTSTTISPPSSPPPSNIDDIDAIAMPPLDHFHVASSSSTSMMVHDSPLPSDLDHHHDHDDDNTLNAATAEKQHVIETTSLPA
uniref:BZIP domain-containing protein n=1 Tax=Minutocellus polymorphus TaxID=265543 RepID=A0A7S0ADU3_9STRA|mmetsp:Transcript_11768/g.19591  ORF Transcript_11768/g.19591 Transcript_11768/m.19591 type:complete len:230 (+) Transcript_11768:239-928(+)